MLKKSLNRLRRKTKIRSKITWTSTIPRMSIFKSNKCIYVQVIDDSTWKTLVSSSDIKMDLKLTKTERATKVWEDIAKKALEKKLDNVVFDRGWFLYHWRVKALADSARNNGLKF